MRQRPKGLDVAALACVQEFLGTSPGHNIQPFDCRQDWDRCVRNREVTAAPDRSGMSRSGTDQKHPSQTERAGQ
jgi:hypothetical protein